jgi:hypothetical protein
MQQTFELIDTITSDDIADRYDENVRFILKQIYDQPGLINNIIFNLNQPRDDDPVVLSFQIVLIGTMCQHIQKFTKSKCMVETGSYNLIYILSKMSNLDFK